MTTAEIAVKEAKDAKALRIFAEQLIEKTENLTDADELKKKIAEFRKDIESVK